MNLSTTPLLLKLRFSPEGASCPSSSNHRPPESIARLIGSSVYDAIADDALKDEDNAGWVMQLEESVQQEWVERIRWIRLVDRLAESELGVEPSRFDDFVAIWQMLHQQGTLPQSSPYTSILAGIRDRWFHVNGSVAQPATVQAWNQYLTAIATYNNSNLVIATCGEYEQVLSQLAGSFFQILPFLAEHHYAAACQFGIVDQFYNHLRDLQEDAAHGICYFPQELLHQFGVSREDIVQYRALKHPRYYRMMQFWLDVYLPRVRRKVRALATTNDLHPSWQVLCTWSMRRYQRIEQVFRECEFDYTLFPHVYWKRVRSELPVLLNEVQKMQIQCPGGTDFARKKRILPSFKPPAAASNYRTFPLSLFSSAM